MHTNQTDPAADDPDIAALLVFPAVERKNKRRDGWSPWHQRRFIAWLAATGNVDKAAQAVGRTQSGAWGVRNAMGGEGFSQAWDAALDLFHARRRAGNMAELRADPPGPRHTPRHAREVREAKAFRGPEPDLDEAEKKELLEEIFKRYVVKLQAERTARLDGRVVEADFYVRQLTFIELALDVGGRTHELLDSMSWDGLHLLQVSATPAAPCSKSSAALTGWKKAKPTARRPRRSAATTSSSRPAATNTTPNATATARGGSGHRRRGFEGGVFRRRGR